MTGAPPTRERLVRYEDPQTIAAASRALAGPALLAGLIDGTLPRPPIMHLAGFRLVEFGDGRALVEYEPDESHYNPFGAVQGGVLTTVFDGALGCALSTKMPAGVAYSTVELSTNYVRPVLIGTGKLLCEGRAIHVGRRVATADAKLTDPAGKVYAHATTTCIVFPARES